MKTVLAWIIMLLLPFSGLAAMALAIGWQGVILVLGILALGTAFGCAVAWALDNI